jgi:hypothetical protein
MGDMDLSRVHMAQKSLLRHMTRAITLLACKQHPQAMSSGRSYPGASHNHIKYALLVCPSKLHDVLISPLTSAVQDISDLLVAVDVLLIKHLDLLLVAGQLVLGDGDDLLQDSGRVVMVRTAHGGSESVWACG